MYSVGKTEVDVFDFEYLFFVWLKKKIERNVAI